MSDGKPTRAVVLFSGGVDSTVALALACWEYREVYPLSFFYGQRHACELTCAQKIADAAGLTLQSQIINADVWRQLPLSDGANDDLERGRHLEAIRTPHYRSRVTGPRSLVPARNMVFLSYGIAHAAMLGGGDLIIGATATDAAGFPDCRPAFLTAMGDVARAGLPTDRAVRIRAPLVRMEKAAVVYLGRQMGVDFSATWSCYRPSHTPALGGDYPCGVCDACVLRVEAFRQADIWERINPPFRDVMGAASWDRNDLLSLRGL